MNGLAHDPWTINNLFRVAWTINVQEICTINELVQGSCTKNCLVSEVLHYKRPFTIKRLAITLMYCNRLQAWWSTQSRLATLLSSLIARRWVGLQTL